MQIRRVRTAYINCTSFHVCVFCSLLDVCHVDICCLVIVLFEASQLYLRVKTYMLKVKHTH